MEVWILLETYIYTGTMQLEQSIEGVYSTVEKALEANKHIPFERKNYSNGTFSYYAAVESDVDSIEDIEYYLEKYEVT